VTLRPRLAPSAASLLLLVFLAVHEAAATSNVPYGAPFLVELRDEFFHVSPAQAGDPDAAVRLDAAKLAAFRAQTARKLRFVSEHVERYERLERRRSAKKASARARTRDTVIALEHVLQLLERMEATSDTALQQRFAAEAIMVDYATRSYTDPLGSIKIPVHLWNIVFDWSLPSGQRVWGASREAGNLLDPESGGFLTPDELRERIRSGEDLSLLDPPSETPFWRAPTDIASVDVVEHYLGGGIPVQRGARAVFPDDGVHFEFDKVHLTQSKPKIDVRWKDAACRARPAAEQKGCAGSYKLKFGMETHADPVANALIAALGYNADLSKHLKNVRIDLGDFSFEELDRQWVAYFDQQRVHTFIPLRSVLLPGAAGRGRDESGEYVVFQEAVAEYKPADIDRIGFWAFAEGMGATAREARALHLFNVWIGNADMKDEENNKLSLRTGASGELEMFLTQQDLGHALGLVLPERVDAFPWDAVELSPWSRFFGWLRGRTELNYVNLQQAGLEWNTSWADAKWMARRIAQLSRSQIEAAVALGRWPEGPRALYVEKLLNRRNQFVTLFGLEDEFGLLTVDRKLTTPDGSVVDGELVQSRFPDESPIEYGQHTYDVLMPAVEYTADGLTRAFQAAVGSIDEINPGTFDVHGDWEVAPGVVVKVSRRLYPNPEAQGRSDQHIVQDTLRGGLRIGIGNGAFIEASGAQTLSLAYPVASVREGLRAQDRLLPLWLPSDLRRGELPERYVLVRERHARLGASARSSRHIDLTGGASASLGRVLSERTVIDHRDAEPIVYRDTPRYWGIELRALARLGLVEVPFAKSTRRSGHFTGGAWRLDAARLDAASAVEPEETVFARILRGSDLDEVERIAAAPVRPLEADLKDSRFWVGLFFASFDERSRATATREGEVDQWDYDRSQTSTWSFIDNGEEFIRAVRARLEGDRGVVHLRWFIDDLNTGSDELDRYYEAIRAFAPASEFVAPGFVARDWEVSAEVDGRWTRMKTSIDLHLHPEALKRLCRLDADAVFGALASGLDADAVEVERARARLATRDLKRRSIERRRLLSRTPDRVRRASSVLRQVGGACARPPGPARLQALADALFAATRGSAVVFDPAVLAAVLEAAGRDELADQGALLLEARLHKAFEDEHNLPERRDLVGRIGKRSRRIPGSLFPLLPDAGVEHWKQLDWVRAAEARASDEWTPAGPGGTHRPGP